LVSAAPAAANASWESVVVDQLELAAAAEGWGGGGLLGWGAGTGAADASGAGDDCDAEESVSDPHQRVRRLPLLLLGWDSFATEVLHALGEASAVRVGGAGASFRGTGASPPLTVVLKLGIASARGRATALAAP
jgi:hypothetical protein